MGCIYKRGDVYWIKYYRNGKPYQESTHSEGANLYPLLFKTIVKKAGGKLSQK